VNTRSTISIIVVILILGGIYAITSYQIGVRTQEHVSALDSDDTASVTRAMDALGSQSPGIVPRIEPLLTNDDPLVRSRAVVLIGMCGTSGDSAVLLPLLKSDGDKFVRRDVTVALGKLGGEGVVPALMTVVADEQEEMSVRAGAATALGALETLEAVPALLKALDTRPPAAEPSPDENADEEEVEDLSRPLRVAAAEALGHLQFAKGLDALRAAADEATEPADVVRIAAVYALGDIAVGNDNDEELRQITEGLVAAYADSVGDVRIAAVQSLGKVRFFPEALHAPVSQLLSDAEDDAHYWVREAARQSRRNIEPLEV
jgi:HEAT repeat protein